MVKLKNYWTPQCQEVVSWKELERWEVGLVDGLLVVIVLTAFRVWLWGVRERIVGSGNTTAEAGGHLSRWNSPASKWTGAKP